MKRKLIINIAALLLIGTGPFQWNCSTHAAGVPGSHWQLVWHDNFTKPGKPNPKKWSFERGFVRNKELQYYQPANAFVRNGILTIEARRQKVKNRQYRPDATDWRFARKYGRYTSASLDTRGKESWLYGRFEIRAKPPAGPGMWPAIWLLGTDITKVGWPHCGEIDIMEFLGRQPRIIHGTVHWGAGIMHKQATRQLTLPVSASDGFHTYRIDWSPRHIKFYVDRTMYFSYNVAAAGKGPNNPFHKPMYLILNLALGGNWAGPVDNKVLPARYEIRYVRVYQRKAIQRGRG